MKNKKRTKKLKKLRKGFRKKKVKHVVTEEERAKVMLDKCLEVKKILNGTTLFEAFGILENEKSIINLNGSMGEGKTMSPYSELIIKRSEIYGVIDE